MQNNGHILDCHIFRFRVLALYRKYMNLLDEYFSFLLIIFHIGFTIFHDMSQLFYYVLLQLSVSFDNVSSFLELTKPISFFRVIYVVSLNNSKSFENV